jgi:hypothetical protein
MSSSSSSNRIYSTDSPLRLPIESPPGPILRYREKKATLGAIGPMIESREDELNESIFYRML